VKAKRDAWFERFADVRVDQLVFLDEFGAATNMTRAYALAPVGERAVCKHPHGHWKLISTIAAMTTCGMIAAASFDGATDTETFARFVEEELVPQMTPGQLLVLDNLPAHRSPRVDTLEQPAASHVLRLPPYSPDYNPIEMAISKIKRLLRSEAARTIDTLMPAIDQALRAVTPDDAKAFIRHCGYADTNV
jgi:transposase